MSIDLGIELNQSKFQDDGIKTQMQQTTQLESRRVATQQVPMKKSLQRNLRTRLFQKTQFPSISNKGIYKQKQFTLNSAIEKLIEQEIKKGQLFVSSSQIKYPVKPLQKTPQKVLSTEQINKKKLQEMSIKKFQTIQILKQLQNEEIQLRKKTVSLRYQKQSDQRKNIKKERSIFSPQQRRVVKKMFIRNKMLQNQLKQKTEQKIQEYRRILQTQRHRYNSELQRHKSLSKSRIEQKFELIKLKKSSQQKQRQRIEKNFEQVKNRRYLYQQMLQKCQKEAMQQMNEFTNKLQSIKSKMKVTIVQELKQHKKKYNQILKQKSTQSSKSKLSLDMNSSHFKKLQENYFTRLTKAERQTKRQKDEMQRTRPFQLKQKVKKFSQRCESQVRPKIKITQESRFIPCKRNQSLNSLNYFQQYEKGKEYLTIAKKLKKCETAEDQKVLNSNEQQKIPNPPAKINYKNYLKDMKRSSQQNSQNPNKKFALYLQKQGSISDYNSLQKAVTISQSIEAKNKKTRNQKLIEAVQNKIQLLKMIL